MVSHPPGLCRPFSHTVLHSGEVNTFSSPQTRHSVLFAPDLLSFPTTRCLLPVAQALAQQTSPLTKHCFLIRVDHSLLRSSRTLDSDCCYVTCFTLSAEIHRSIFPTLETRHLEGAPSLGRGALHEVEGPECIAVPLHHSFPTAGCEGSIQLLARQNHISEVTPQASRDDGSRHAWRNPPVPGVQGHRARHLSDFVLTTIPDAGVLFPVPDMAIKAFKSFCGLLRKYGEGLTFEPSSGNTHQKSQMLLPSDS